MADVKFDDYSAQVVGTLNDKTIAWLDEAAGEIQAGVIRNTRRDQGQLASSWTYVVDENAGVATIGSPLENAIWEEFGTGEYALNGDGRKGGWYIHESQLSPKAKSRMRKVIGKDGEVYYFTRGKKGTRAFHNAYEPIKSKLKLALENLLKELNG